MHRTFPACKILLFALRHQPRFASARSAASMPYTTSLYRVAGMPVDFMMSGVTLLGAALFHAHTLRVASLGAIAITLYPLQRLMRRLPVFPSRLALALSLIGAAIFFVRCANEPEP